LDEVTAHMDVRRRAALARALDELGAQAWLSGTERGLFAALDGRATFLEIDNGTIVGHERASHGAR
jgi:DNA replication and repair protein RecF